jgi:maltose/moltooligosaccharide transporter
MTSEQSTARLLANMNLGFWGMQVGNGLQTANASAIFEGLGAEASQLPLLWLGAPLLGLIVQPLVGELSDRTWSAWGRRQPYFLLGAVVGAVTLIALPLSTQLWQAIVAFWLLQLGLNIAIAPARPFVGDLLPVSDRMLGYSVQGFCVGLGALAASGLPWVLEHGLQLNPSTDTGIPSTILGAYVTGAVVLLGSTLWTFWTVSEPAPHAHADPIAASHDIGEPFKAVIRAIIHMPPVMQQLISVQTLTWAGIYCTFLYLPTAIALHILDAPNRQSSSYVHGVEWAGVCIAFYNLICLGVSFLLPGLCRRWGRVTLHAGCLMCGAVGLVSLGWIHSRYPILLSMIGFGIAWASVLSIPYSLLMDELSEEQSGVYMGVFNMFVTLPQLVMSLGFGWVMKTLLQGDRLWALMLGGIFMGLAAFVMLSVADPSPAPRQTSLTSGDQALITKE